MKNLEFSSVLHPRLASVTLSTSKKRLKTKYSIILEIECGNLNCIAAK